MLYLPDIITGEALTVHAVAEDPAHNPGATSSEKDHANKTDRKQKRGGPAAVRSPITKSIAAANPMVVVIAGGPVAAGHTTNVELATDKRDVDCAQFSDTRRGPSRHPLLSV
jgi:hypothetical protein